MASMTESDIVSLVRRGHVLAQLFRAIQGYRVTEGANGTAGSMNNTSVFGQIIVGERREDGTERGCGEDGGIRNWEADMRGTCAAVTNPKDVPVCTVGICALHGFLS